jgi:L-lactate dehydrogenase
MRTRATSASVAVLGAGHVGAAITHTLVLQGIAERVILHDRQRARAEGEAWDIGDTTPLLHEGTVLPTDDYRDLADSDVVVVTVGANIKSGQSRLEVLGQNADLIRSVMGELDKVSREAVVVIATTPVDILTRIAIACSARPEHQILGSGTVVDTARLRYRLAATLGVNAEDTLVHVLGEHGDSQFAAWSSAAIGSIPLASFPVPSGMSLAQIQADCETTTRRRAADIHARKG